MISYSRKRSIIAILSIAYLIFSVFLSWILSNHIIFKSDICTISVFAIITSLNITIFFSWTGLGFIAGAVVTIFSFLFIFLLSFKTRIYTFHFYALASLFTAAIGYILFLRKYRFDQLYVLKMERLDEDINVLKNEISESARAIKVTEEKIMRYSLLKRLSELLSAVLDIDEIGRILINGSLKIIGKKGRVLFFLLDPDTHELKLASSHVGRGMVIKEKMGDEFDFWVLRYRKSLIVEDLLKDFRFSNDTIDKAAPEFRSIIAMPMIIGNKVIGIIRMDNPKDSFYTQDDLRILGIIADIGAVAIQNAIFYSRTQELAIRDSLTGLKVRRFFMESFYREIKRASRKREHLSLIVLDIDYFKSYNDKYGHTSGDFVIKSIADMISDSLGEADVGGRFGGEELVLLLWNKTKKEAFYFAEGLRQAIKKRRFVLKDEEAYVTVSMGISSYPEDAISEDELIKIADIRLYKAKSDGRDRVCCD